MKFLFLKNAFVFCDYSLHCSFITIVHILRNVKKLRNYKVTFLILSIEQVLLFYNCIMFLRLFFVDFVFITINIFAKIRTF